jgi:hypothetical protein
MPSTTPAAGARIKAANTPAPYVVSAACSSNLSTSSSTAADLVGATVTFTTAQANATAMVIGVFDVTTSSTGGNGVGTCVVDSSTQSGQAIHALATSNDRDTVSQTWNITLSSAGSHTIKLQGAATSTGTALFGNTHSTITVLVLDW